MLECTDLHRSFGTLRAVDGVSFAIGPGETYGLLGPNGAGKTTTISMVVGVLAVESGAIVVDGMPMHPQSLQAKSLIGYVPQDVAVYPDLTGRENLRFFASLYHLDGRAARVRVDRVLEIVGLTERADERSQHYSGGMKRRLNIAVGLIHEPRLLVLDEPTVGVDPQSRNAILASIEQLSDEGMAVLYTTHYMEEAERLCDRVAIVDHGKIIAQGPPADLVAGLHAPHIVEFASEPALSEEDLRAMPGVRDFRRRDDRWFVSVAALVDAVPALLSRLDRQGARLLSLSTHRATLEDVFIALTGRELRDE